MKSLFNIIRDLIYPGKCPFCAQVIPRESLACGKCHEEAISCEPRKTVIKDFICISPFPYSGIYKDAALLYKFGKIKRSAECMAAYMSRIIREYYSNEEITLVTCVPFTRRQIAERGFNPARELAVQVAASLGLPYSDCLIKTRENRPQHKLKKTEREQNVKGAFRINDYGVKGETILLIDDISTTGCTLCECGKVLKKAGNRVLCATFCKTESFQTW